LTFQTKHGTYNMPNTRVLILEDASKEKLLLKLKLSEGNKELKLIK